MSMILRASSAALAALLTLPAHAQDEGESTPSEPTIEKLDASMFGALRFRSIGPAINSGRISDFAVNPQNHSEYYVTTASGGIWKTTNAGTTFSPIFDSQASYSIGCIAMDPSDPNTLWVGTGENNSQRSVSFGDGVYKSVDGGRSWKNVGLKDSEHIGMIQIDPRNGDIVYVAAQGPLWRGGGDRGVYKTTNGGKSWDRVLHVSDDTGINEVHMDPRNPNTLYASSYQRRRRQWTLVDGGPESTIYKSTDAGRSWNKISRGLPGGDVGRIGMDISPANPDVLYAIVTATGSSSGFFRSDNAGVSWRRMSGYKTSSPQYYNEIFADPHDVDRVYLCDTFLMVTGDGGASFGRAGESRKHVDNHVVWIDPGDENHLLVGCDGGVYETFDQCGSYRFMPNLPITQFYRVAVDTAEPFYNVYGGTQDNNTLGGPSRTVNRVGIVNSDWFVTVGGDGFETAVDPEDPMIVYSQWQYGGLVRHDRRSGETVDIKPHPSPDEDPYVFNWDAPLIISPHSNTRLYFGGRRLFRSDDRGNSWTPVSDDLTRGLDRTTLEIMGKVQKPEAVDKDQYTSIYGSTISLSESPLIEGLIYVGTDDGLIQVTEDDGESWRKIDVFPGVPHMTYVSDIEASRHDADTVYATFDNHKSGDFTAYVLKSTDRGQTWVSVAGDLPERNIAYSLSEDHVDPDLLFLGTEFACYWTRNGGKGWHKIAGLPPIAVRDVEIQRRENDVVLATFGRGFYVLDDYTPLREANDGHFKADAFIFPVRDALQYVPTGYNGAGSKGASYYSASNPAFGATMTIHVKDVPKNPSADRKKQTMTAENYPSLDVLRAEDRETSPAMYLTIRDGEGEIVSRQSIGASKGMRRVTWNLRYSGGGRGGPMVAPGTYSAQISLLHNGEVTELGEAREFNVVSLDRATFATDDPDDKLAFQHEAIELYQRVQAAQSSMGEVRARHDAVRRVVLASRDADLAMLEDLKAVNDGLADLGVVMSGDRSASRRQYPTAPGISSRVSTALFSTMGVSSAPTQTQRDQLQYAGELFEDALETLLGLDQDMNALEAELDAIGAAWTPGRTPTKNHQSEKQQSSR